MSEAAKPADPERALARLTTLRASYVNEHSPLYRDERRAQLGHALIDAAVDGWLLPLARAGLDRQRRVMPHGVLFSEIVLGDVQRATGIADLFAGDARCVERIRNAFVNACADLYQAARDDGRGTRSKAQDALRVEFTACVRALFAAVHCEVRTRVNENPHPSLCASHRAEAQIALSGPLAAAVLRSPEPATPADGGA